MKRLIARLAIVLAVLAAPAALLAHAGHAHKVMGTVESVDGNHVTVKSADGKSVMVMLDAKTKITRGKTTLDASALKVGERVVAEGPEQQSMIVATSVKLGVTPAVAKK